MPHTLTNAIFSKNHKKRTKNKKEDDVAVTIRCERQINSVREEVTAANSKHLFSMGTAPRNVPALDDVDGPEDLDKFVRELMDNMVRNLNCHFEVDVTVCLQFRHFIG